MSMTSPAISQTTGDQFLDYCLLPEVLKGKPRGYARRVQGRLAEYNILRSKQSIYSRAQKILSGRAVIRPVATFHNVPGYRGGKDLNYAGFWSMVDLFLPNKKERVYVGLTGNHIDVIREHIGATLTACERDTKTVENLKALTNLILNTKGVPPTIQVIHTDIFEYLAQGHQFNIFDLDLMQTLPCPSELTHWAQLLQWSTTRGARVAVNLTAAIGRSITEVEHNKRAEYFRAALDREGLRELGHSRFAYRDRKIPMRAERLILKRR
jgi:hypothetical protein